MSHVGLEAMFYLPSLLHTKCIEVFSFYSKLDTTLESPENRVSVKDCLDQVGLLGVSARDCPNQVD